MSVENDQNSLEVARTSRRRPRDIHLPSIDPGCYVALSTLNLGKYEDSLLELVKPVNWNDLRTILSPALECVVKDALGQHFVDSVRRRFNAAMLENSGRPISKPFVMQILDQGGSSNVDILKMLLAVGVDPDQANCQQLDKDWRPAHWCGFLARVDLAGLIFPCRPNMEAKCDKGYTPLQVADRTLDYLADEKYPYRKARRVDVENYIKNGGFEMHFPTLPELAVREQWFAVKNLLRRQVVAESEFTEKIEGKTAAEWAEFFKESGIAAEICYYAKAPSVRHDETIKLLAAVVEKLYDHEEEAYGVSSKKTKLEKQVEELQKEVVAKDAKNDELSEAVSVFRAKLEEAGIGCELEKKKRSEN